MPAKFLELVQACGILLMNFSQQPPREEILEANSEINEEHVNTFNKECIIEQLNHIDKIDNEIQKGDVHDLRWPRLTYILKQELKKISGKCDEFNKSLNIDINEQFRLKTWEVRAPQKEAIEKIRNRKIISKKKIKNMCERFSHQNKQFGIVEQDEYDKLSDDQKKNKLVSLILVFAELKFYNSEASIKKNN